MGERERKRFRDRQRQTQGERRRNTQGERQREAEKQTERETDRQTGRLMRGFSHYNQGCLQLILLTRKSFTIHKFMFITTIVERNVDRWV